MSPGDMLAAMKENLSDLRGATLLEGCGHWTSRNARMRSTPCCSTGLADFNDYLGAEHKSPFWLFCIAFDPVHCFRRTIIATREPRAD